MKQIHTLIFYRTKTIIAQRGWGRNRHIRGPKIAYLSWTSSTSLAKTTYLLQGMSWYRKYTHTWLFLMQFAQLWNGVICTTSSETILVFYWYVFVSLTNFSSFLSFFFKKYKFLLNLLYLPDRRQKIQNSQQNLPQNLQIHADDEKWASPTWFLPLWKIIFQ